VKSHSRLDSISELAEQGNVLFDPPSTGCPFAERGGIPVDANVLEVFKHCDAGCTSGALRTVEMEVRSELARAQVARHMRVINQRGQVIHCGVKNGIQTGVSLSSSCSGHHPNIPRVRRQS
jgi:hypothetical protein